MATMKSNGCPKGQHMVDGICTPKPFSSIGSQLGLGLPIAGAIGLTAKAIADKVKAKKAAKAEEQKRKAEEAAKEMPKQKRRGGATTKLKKANNGTVVKSNAPSYTRSQAKAEELYDSDPSVRAYTNGPMTREEYQNAAATAASKRAKALGAGPTMRRGGMTKTKYMTGGMVNANAKVSALKSAGSKGVKSGVNPKAKATGKATGRTGGTSKAPKVAKPTKNKRG